MNDLKVGFEMRRIVVPIGKILPLRQIKDPQGNVKKYRKIKTSIKEVGMIEPLMVYPQKGGNGMYLLLDGHLRLIALKELGVQEAQCIIATDDESFTYNARVNRLNPIAEHRMIMKVVQNGVRPEKIAAALNMPITEVKASMSLINGIHEEAVELLKDKPISRNAIYLMRKVTGVRQIEIAELMVSANNYTKTYAEALVLGTPKDQLLKPHVPKRKQGMSREQIAKLEEEMETLERDFHAVEKNFGENMLHLTVVRGYIKKLLENGKLVRFLNGNYSDILAEFENCRNGGTVVRCVRLRLCGCGPIELMAAANNCTDWSTAIQKPCQDCKLYKYSLFIFV